MSTRFTLLVVYLMTHFTFLVTRHVSQRNGRPRRYGYYWSCSRSGLVVRLPCVRTQVRISPRTVVFITTVTAICSLGHGLRNSTAVPRSTQHCIPPWSLNRVPDSAGVKAAMTPLQVISPKGAIGVHNPFSLFIIK